MTGAGKDNSPFSSIENSRILSCVFFELSTKTTFTVIPRVSRTWRAIVSGEKFQKSLIDRAIEKGQFVQAYRILMKSPLRAQLVRGYEFLFTPFEQYKPEGPYLPHLSIIYRAFYQDQRDYSHALKLGDRQEYFDLERYKMLSDSVHKSMIVNLLALYDHVRFPRSKTATTQMLTNTYSLIQFAKCKHEVDSHAVVFLLNHIFRHHSIKLLNVFQSEIIHRLATHKLTLEPFCPIKTLAILEIYLETLYIKKPRHWQNIYAILNHLSTQPGFIGNEYFQTLVTKYNDLRFLKTEKKSNMKPLAIIGLALAGGAFVYNWFKKDS